MEARQVLHRAIGVEPARGAHQRGKESTRLGVGRG
jgi:hypothetical protein